MAWSIWAAAALAALSAPAPDAPAVPYHQRDFTAQDFAARRAIVFDAIGKGAVAVVQGRADTGDMSSFRQSNEFYYLTGLEVPHAYLLLEGKTRRTTLYLPRRDSARDAVEGETLAAEDSNLVMRLTGADAVQSFDQLAKGLAGSGLIRPPAPLLYTPLSPAETVSRDTLLASAASIASDPWDGGEPREGRFRNLIQSRFPQFDIRDLTPILDAQRLIKSDKEIALIRAATRLAGNAITEAMRSTVPGTNEHELDAMAKYIFFLGGARGEGYASIIGGGSNAFYGHYWRKTDALMAGDMLLMDYAPDYRYYTSDVARMWPVSGHYSAEQRALCQFILAYRDALIRAVRPGVTSDQVLDAAATEMTRYLADHPFTYSAHAVAAQDALKFRGHFQHSVGMAVHDVGTLRGVPLRPGMVFTVDPMMWLRGEKLYFRIEDIVLVTRDGVENLSAFVPARLPDIERTIAEPGLLQATASAPYRSGQATR